MSDSVHYSNTCELLCRRCCERYEGDTVQFLSFEIYSLMSQTDSSSNSRNAGQDSFIQPICIEYLPCQSILDAGNKAKNKYLCLHGIKSDTGKNKAEKGDTVLAPVINKVFRGVFTEKVAFE